MGRHTSVLDKYEEEVSAHGIACPSIEELVERLGGKELRERARRESAPQDRYPEVYSRLMQLIATVKSTGLEAAVREFLDKVALSRSDGVGLDSNRVSLLTFHATKGLEFSRVYVIGVEDNQLPGYYAMKENREADIREARRLLYVAMTRAKDRLILTRCVDRERRPTGGTLFLSDMGLTDP